MKSDRYGSAEKSIVGLGFQLLSAGSLLRISASYRWHDAHGKLHLFCCALGALGLTEILLYILRC